MLRPPSSTIDRLGRRAAHVEDDDVAVAARQHPSRAAPTTPPAGPEADREHRPLAGPFAASMPPFEVMTSIGAATPMAAAPFRAVR